MELKDEKPSSTEYIEESPFCVLRHGRQQAQLELGAANRALKQAGVALAAAVAAGRAAAEAEAEAFRTRSLAEGRVEDCQKRLYELS